MNAEIVDDVLDRAEFALRRSPGKRRESEIAFVEQMLRELGGQWSGLSISPAQLFRSVVREGSQLQGLGNLLKVIGVPSKRVAASLQPGDWMIRVIPGTGDVGHLSILASADLVSRSQLIDDGIPAESSQPGHYGTVIEGGAYPHNRRMPFARRFLDSNGRVPPHTVILRPRSADTDATNEDAFPSWQREPVEDNLEPYRIEGGKYTPQEKQHAAEHRAGLIRTSSIIGKQEQKLTRLSPAPISVAKELMRFEGGTLGQYVFDWNDFTVYLDELLHGIGRLRDLLSAGAPQSPSDMTAVQKRALRPTDDTWATGGIKVAYEVWRKSQANYATTGKGGLPSGLVFEFAEKRRAVELARQNFWEVRGSLSRTIAGLKHLDKPKYEGLELKLSDIASMTNPWSALATGVDKMLDARKARDAYDAKIKEFAAAVQVGNDKLKDEFETLRNAGSIFWDKNLAHRKAGQDLEEARIQSRKDAALVGQSTAGHSETRDKILAEVRMPELVADAWHALASIGPPARTKLLNILAQLALVDRASFKFPQWTKDPLGLEDITQLRLAWNRAKSWEPILTKEDIADWVAENKSWEEALAKFNV